MSKKRAEALINLNNIKNNYNTIKTLTLDSKIICVVKADAYGHGAVEVSKALLECNADIFAVACMDEALVLRSSGIEQDIIILGITPLEQIEFIAPNNFIQTVSSVEYAEKLSQLGTNTRIHIKIDTGMSRLGLYCHTSDDIGNTIDKIKSIRNKPGIIHEGTFTHFACSDEVLNPMTGSQYKLFMQICEECELQGIDLGMRHCCNSGAILNFPEMRLDAVRAGLLLYGLSPLGDIPAGFLPAMELVSQIAQITTLNKGDSISYNAKYTASSTIKTAVISIGYADGLSRSLSGKGYIYINNKPAKILGQICMDLCIVDITDIPCKLGDTAVIFNTEHPVEEISEQMGTIVYEILCSVKNRVPRRYI